MSRVLPILFNTDMVRAILDRRKMVTRRVIRDNVCIIRSDQEINKNLKGQFELYNVSPRCGIPQGIIFKPPYQQGDILYVRETWYKDSGRYMYRADYSKKEKFYRNGKEIQMKWHPSIHMPKEAARIWLEVTDVRVERLQDITEEQVEAEGFEFTAPCLRRVSEDSYCDLDGPCLNKIKYCDMSAGELFGKVLWDSTLNKSDLVRYGWEANPWVWVIKFGRNEHV